MYHYIDLKSNQIYNTCVGYGLENDVCPAHGAICTGFSNVDGLATYGGYGDQARAVRFAIEQADNIHPYCPDN
eukprot:UN30517